MAAAAHVNATAAALLGLLQDGAATGGELVAAAAVRYQGFFGLTRSQVYRELPLLVDRGLLRLGRRGARSSQAYQVSAAGRRAFLAWLAEGGGDAPVESVRSPLLLRLVHADTLLEPDRSVLLAHAAAAVDDQLAVARAAVAGAEDVGARAAAEFVVAHLQALARAVDTVAGRPSQ
ncbi:MAG: hypothetical protein ABI181_01565 [Mycobacteriaceae bacterium]